MSHDRGCPCGKERYEYDDCTKPDCIRRRRSPAVKPLGPRKHYCEAKKTCTNIARYEVNRQKLCKRHAGDTLLTEMTK